MNESFITGLGFGTGLAVASLLFQLIPLLMAGGILYLLAKFLKEEEVECENGQI